MSRSAIFVSLLLVLGACGLPEEDLVGEGLSGKGESWRKLGGLQQGDISGAGADSVAARALLAGLPGDCVLQDLSADYQLGVVGDMKIVVRQGGSKGSYHLQKGRLTSRPNFEFKDSGSDDSVFLVYQDDEQAKCPGYTRIEMRIDNSTGKISSFHGYFYSCLLNWTSNEVVCR